MMRKEKVSKCENGQQKVCKFQYTSHAKEESGVSMRKNGPFLRELFTQLPPP